MSNTIQHAAVFQNTLDKQMAQQSVTGWMEPNASLVKYKGGREVKVPLIDMDGLGDYDRTAGYVDGSVTLEWETYKMTQDRGRKFQIDAMDVDETNFVLTAANLAGEFQCTKVIPEVDAYRISRIIQLIGNERMRAYTPAANTVFGAFIDDLNVVRNRVGDGVPLVALISIPVHALLSKAAEYGRQVELTNFSQGGIETRVKSIDGVPLIRAGSDLMKSAFVFQDGKTAGQEKGGFVAADDAVDINWIIMARNAPMAISKTDLPRFFNPLVNQGGNAWRFDFRKYHDLWILKNKLDGVFGNAKALPAGG